MVIFRFRENREVNKNIYPKSLRLEIDQAWFIIGNMIKVEAKELTIESIGESYIEGDHQLHLKKLQVMDIT